MQKTFSILTLGCKVNQYESESMAELFEKSGYKKVLDFSQSADVYVVNTCTVTNLSDRKSRQFIRRAKKLNPNSTIAVVGCYSQVSPDEVQKIEGVDVVIGTSQKDKIVSLCEESKEKKKKINVVEDIKSKKDFQNIKINKSLDMTRTYIKVQDGCNRFCSYCIIPYARGQIRSRNLSDSVNEAMRLRDAGYREVVLTGIHIGSYGYDLGKTRLIDLIEEIAKIDGIDRIRLSSVEPGIISEDFMKRANATKKLCDHFHLSLQSGSNKVLKDMNRHYTREEFIEKAHIIKRHMPYAALTTDIIVGFPTETEEDFSKSMSIVEEVGFSKLHVFKYSPRKNTPAADIKEQVDGNVKIERSQRLIQKGEIYAKLFREENLNIRRQVLFERKVGKFYEGYTTNYIRVKLNSDEDLKNVIKDVKIISTAEIADCEVL